MTLQTLAFWGFAVVGVIILGFAATILWKVVNDDISLDGLLMETGPDGARKASLSRFQLLIFTFVFAGLFLLLSIEAGTFVEIPTNVLSLIGISSGSYVVSKALGKNGKAAPKSGTAEESKPKQAEERS